MLILGQLYQENKIYLAYYASKPLHISYDEADLSYYQEIYQGM